MKRQTTPLLLTLLLAADPLAAQEPGADAPVATKPGEADRSGWSQGLGRGPSYRSALAAALEDAVGRANGIEISVGPVLKSRIAVVTDSKEGDQKGWFDGQSESENAWVQQQLQGFVKTYEVASKKKGDDGLWEVEVRAHVLGVDDIDSTLVVELVDNDLTEWQLERFEEDGPGRPFDRTKGRFDGPEIAEYLRNSGVVKIVSGGPGVQLGNNSARDQRAKAGRELVASHRVTIAWQPLLVQSVVEKPNPARPRRGKRPEYMSGGAVTVNVRIEDLIERTELLDKPYTITVDPDSYSSERVDAFVRALVDEAKAVVAREVFFTLRPPQVVRRWAGDGGAWFVEARISKRIASTFRGFEVGNAGSLQSVDWQKLADARLVGGSGATCTFELVDAAEPNRIEPGTSQVRPVR